MAKKRIGLAFSLVLIVATMVIIATLFAVKFYQDQERQRETVPPAPVPADLPKIEPAKPPAIKQKPPIKPPKISAPLTTIDEDIPGKIRLCPGNRETATIAGDGRLLGHHPYADASTGNLGAAPAGFNSGSCSQLHGEAKVALEQLMSAARASDPAIADAMIGLSCFRSAKYQREVFCRKVGDGYAVRAQASAPPGYSEHATGYALDFGDRNNPQCHLSACFATTPVGEWLATNAGQYGFVLSFPKGNGQGVMYEPWHWRYEGSGAARSIFSKANE